MSTIVADNLTGKTAAGNVTVTSEGGSATMQLQQGLAKAWMNLNGTGTIATRDTLNVSSLSDEATGKYQVNFSSSMGNDDYTVSGGARSPGVASGTLNAPTDAANNMLTDSIEVYSLDLSGNPTDLSYVLTVIHGDLA